jgi:AcrR family transcriptional regulator
MRHRPFALPGHTCAGGSTALTHLLQRGTLRSMSSDQAKPEKAPATKQARPSKHKERVREESIERILDAAEQLFAEYGYHGVTVKDVAARIGVSSTLIHYHFNGKESLYEAVWARKAPISARDRLEAMRRYAEEAGDNVTVEGALHAWIDTDLNLQIDDEPYWGAFGKIAAQANSAAGWGAGKMSKYFSPVALALIDLLKKAMPHCDEEAIFWGYHFVSGAMTHNMARTGRLDELSHGLCASDDLVSIRRHMAKFMAAGFHAICESGPRKE